jgi:hypothetical protein
MRVQGVVGTVHGNRAGLHAKRDILAQGGPTRFGAFTAGRVRSLRQHDLLAPNLVRADADQCLAVRTIDGRLPGDRDTEIFTGAGSIAFWNAMRRPHALFAQRTVKYHLAVA